MKSFAVLAATLLATASALAVNTTQPYPTAPANLKLPAGFGLIPLASGDWTIGQLGQDGNLTVATNTLRTLTNRTDGELSKRYACDYSPGRCDESLGPEKFCVNNDVCCSSSGCLTGYQVCQYTSTVKAPGNNFWTHSAVQNCWCAEVC